MGDIQDVYDGHEFDCTQVEPAKAFEALPAGWYTAMVDESEIKGTKAGTGFYMKVRFSLLDEGMKNRKVFANITLRNPSQQAEEIGMRELSALGHAVGVLNIGDSAQVLNKVLQIKLAIKTSEQYGTQNEVKGYKAQGDAAAVADQPSATEAAPAAPAAAPASVPPWKRK